MEAAWLAAQGPLHALAFAGDGTHCSLPLTSSTAGSCRFRTDRLRASAIEGCVCACGQGACACVERVSARQQGVPLPGFVNGERVRGRRPSRSHSFFALSLSSSRTKKWTSPTPAPASPPPCCPAWSARKCCWWARCVGRAREGAAGAQLLPGSPKPLRKKKRMLASLTPLVPPPPTTTQVENVANNVATVTACDGAPVAVTLATGTQGAALDAPVVEFDCVVSGPGAVEEAGTRSPLSANFGETRLGEGMERS